MRLPDGHLARIPHGAVKTTTIGMMHPTLPTIGNGYKHDYVRHMAENQSRFIKHGERCSMT